MHEVSHTDRTCFSAVHMTYPTPSSDRTRCCEGIRVLSKPVASPTKLEPSFVWVEKQQEAAGSTSRCRRPMVATIHPLSMLDAFRIKKDVNLGAFEIHLAALSECSRGSDHHLINASWPLTITCIHTLQPPRHYRKSSSRLPRGPPASMAVSIVYICASIDHRRPRCETILQCQGMVDFSADVNSCGESRVRETADVQQSRVTHIQRNSSVQLASL
ncbi:hypothetical protein F5Y18DRAFT_186063 [Xylariaceae sp. FL1019]|nr:hypothetical protein F5Y18DRAFT_186063 [Xylariaceae sp. FL1019]